jgi:protease secretion system membrane fusion protein
MSLRSLLTRKTTPAERVPADSVAQLADSEKPMRIGLWVLLLGLGSFLLWAAFAPLDEGVPTQGQVSIDTKRKAVQHLSGGIIREVNIKEGDFVSEGRILIKLDDAVARAGYESIRQHYLTLRAIESRLLAEQGDLPAIEFHPDLKQAQGDSLAQQFMLNQKQVFDARRAAFRSSERGLQESILGAQASLQGMLGTLPHRKSQLATLKEEGSAVAELAREGFATRTKQLELQRMIADISATISDTEGSIERLQRDINQQQQRLAQLRFDTKKEINLQLVDIRREVQADAEKLHAAGEELARTEIRSPAAGQVVGLSVQTVGGVIQPSQKLMDIVPENETLILETRIPPHLIDRLKVGQFTDIRFSAFAHSPQLVVEGKIISISGDLLTDAGNQQQYYLSRVAVTDLGRKELGERQMQPGMPAEVVIKTGERSLLKYLLHPLLKRLASAMIEE